MFVALKPLTESARIGPPIEHAPGDVLERWAEWPYRVRVALLHAEMAEERPDVSRFTAEPASEPSQDIAQDASYLCDVCGRSFDGGAALKRHKTRKHP